MSSRNPNRRDELRGALRRDLARHARRQRGPAAFWRSLTLIGAVGWPIALGGLGGAWLGHWLDERWKTGLAVSVLSLFAGIAIGSWAAWRMIWEKRK